MTRTRLLPPLLSLLLLLLAVLRPGPLQAQGTEGFPPTRIPPGSPYLQEFLTEVYVLPFDGASTALPAEAFTALDTVAARIQAEPETRLALRSYAVGDSATPAKRLALIRALSVRQYLVQRGVPAGRVLLHAVGPARDLGPADRIDVLVTPSLTGPG